MRPLSCPPRKHVGKTRAAVFVFSAMPTLLRFLLWLTLTLPLVAADLPRYEMRQEHHPDGIGKFYMGREIAHVMGHQAADWLERPEREEEERTDLLIDALKLRPGEAVADLGAGTGYMSERMARRVGEKGVVYAVDIQQEMLDRLGKKMRRRGIENIRPILGTATDPKLPAASVDTILMVDVYHELDHPFEMTQAMARALRPGGRIVLVEFRGEDPNVPIKELHKMTEAQLKKEMAAFPQLAWAETLKILPQQHIITFRKKDEVEAGKP